MIHVNQAILTVSGGDCFRACVASIMELPLHDVPHIFEEAKSNDNWSQDNWSELCYFAESKGFRVTWIDPESSEDKELEQKLIESNLYYIAMGPSKRGNWGHCVVHHKGNLVHDPHPNGLGLNGPPWLYVVIIAKSDEEHSITEDQKNVG